MSTNISWKFNDSGLLWCANEFVLWKPDPDVKFFYRHYCVVIVFGGFAEITLEFFNFDLVQLNFQFSDYNLSSVHFSLFEFSSVYFSLL